MQAQELLNFKNWVVVGDVLNSSKYASRILSSLKNEGFNVEGINPGDTTGGIYKSLKEVNYVIDVVDLCINPISGLKILEEIKDLGINKVLIQPGAESVDINEYCKNNEITAMEGCALVELSFYKRKQ
ncbi:CoA-binding protein [Candidatus Clostridium stratigraminis]|uniref:CoA-binding protein n=1 Tax=Candidatus Clostridium stratigraminis TaxID=3381661 RepID=A0ABW8T6U3_9CLOT